MAKKKKSKDIFKVLEKEFEKAEQERKERELWEKPGPREVGGMKRYWTNG